MTPPDEARVPVHDPLSPDAPLPNSLPRPEGELDELERVWETPRGWRFPTVVNNNWIGVLYLGTALLFFVLAGCLALLMRAQLAVPENDLVGHDLYNQLFTTHGTMMMFLFAVPAMEAVGVYLLPAMLAARDLPFPRLSAYAFWAYAIGGLVFFSSIFFGAAPNGGWFMYPPLTSKEYSPGINADFWLLGIGFIEISAIAGAIEIIVGILRNRAPGMTLDRMPIFAWAMLVFAAMIVFAFPAVIWGTILLELERAFDWPFFVPERGGDPLLWQHLFWFFGHPEVYIIFIPAAGMVSMIVPAMVQTRLIGYRLVAMALVGTGFLSFGLWVHHMFTTGIPQLSLAFFSAASLRRLGADRHPGLRLDRHHRLGPPAHAGADAVHPRLPVHLRAGRADRGDGGGRAVRLAGARHLLHRRPPALRADRRHGLPADRSALLLGGLGERQDHVATGSAPGPSG